VVSVCVRAFERRDELREAVQSVLAQTYEGEVEVVVSDDSGALGPVVEAIGDRRVRYVANPAPTGPSGNLRHAASHARGDVIALLNDDDWWEPTFLSTCMEVLDADAGVDVVFTDQWLWVAGRRVRNRFPYAPGRHDRFVRKVLEQGPPASGTVLRRRAFVPPPDGVVGDFHVFLSAASSGHAFHHIAAPLTVTRIHPGQGSWSEPGLPTRMIATLDSFRFDDDPVAEALRRARLAEHHLVRAGRLVRSRQLRRAAVDIRRARALEASLTPVRTALALSGLRELTMRAAPAPAIAWIFERWPGWRPAITRRAPATGR
jgi:glycosyltransferase involved in cell wall biosynthesis